MSLSSKREPFVLGAFYDGRPGHEKQTDAVIAAIEKRVAVRVVPVQVARLNSWLTLVETCALYLRWRIDSAVVQKCHLLIGTGSATHLPMLRARQEYNVPAICCMSPGWHLRLFFDLCLVPEHDGLPEGEKVVNTLGPPCKTNFTGEHDRSKGLILVGGIDQKSHRWDERDVVGRIRAICAHSPGINWLASSSPRTPESSVQLLAQLADKADNLTFVPFSQTPRGWLERRYSESGMVWVTADSISMGFEALATGCLLGLIPVAWKEGSSKFQRNEKQLYSRNLALRLEDWLAGNADFPDTPPKIDEAQRCADLIVEKWLKRN